VKIEKADKWRRETAAKSQNPRPAPDTFYYGWTRINTSAKKVEKGVLESRWRRVLAENGCAQLHVFTRIYTILHKVPFVKITSLGRERLGRSKRPVFPLISGCFRLFPLILQGGG